MNVQQELLVFLNEDEKMISNQYRGLSEAHQVVDMRYYSGYLDSLHKMRNKVSQISNVSTNIPAMKTIPTNSAFPTFEHINPLVPDNQKSGLSKREMFAAFALQGLCANNELKLMSNVNVAIEAVRIADDLIDALNREKAGR